MLSKCRLVADPHATNLPTKSVPKSLAYETHAGSTT
jgi:hypothetical protein